MINHDDGSGDSGPLYRFTKVALDIGPVWTMTDTGDGVFTARQQ